MKLDFVSRRFLLAMLLLNLAACGGGQSTEKKDASAASASVPQLGRGDVLTVAIAPVSATLPFTATLNALSSAEVSSEIDASVREVLVREGESVVRGQLLARLDGDSLQQVVSEQQAQLANDEARLRLAKQKMEKQRELYQQGFVSRFAFDEIESEYRLREGDVQARRSQLARARKSLSDSNVHAPMAGVLYARRVQPGEQVGRNQKLFAIADLSQLEAVAHIPARLVSQLQSGQKAFFQVEGRSGRFNAQLLRINPVANSGSRTYSAYLRVDNRQLNLPAGQFIQGEIVLQEIQGTARLPLTAVRDADSKAPWVMKLAGNRLQKQPVRILLRSDGEQMLAVSGIAAGERVLAAALPGLKAGDSIMLPR